MRMSVRSPIWDIYLVFVADTRHHTREDGVGSGILPTTVDPCRACGEVNEAVGGHKS
jgi:hypothetical protein